MNDHELEEHIRNLRPAPLPDNLKERLRSEPQSVEPPSGTGINRQKVVWAMAACLVGVAVAWFLVSRDGGYLPGTPIVETSPPISVLKEESTLVSTRSLETREHDGRLWELVEERWRDEQVAMCSTTPVTVRSSRIRPERHWVLVELQ